MIFLHIILWNLYLREYTKGQIQLNLVKISISRTLIVTTNKLNRLRWAGHIIHTDENYHPKQILLGRCSNNRSRGRPKLRWIDGVYQDAEALELRCWQTQAKDKNNWRIKLQQAKTRTGLWSGQRVSYFPKIARKHAFEYTGVFSKGNWPNRIK